jgi:hypothetical protein
MHQFEQSHWSQFFFFAPKDKAMMLVQHLSAKLLKLSPENNSSL